MHSPSSFWMPSIFAGSICLGGTLRQACSENAFPKEEGGRRCNGCLMSGGHLLQRLGPGNDMGGHKGIADALDSYLDGARDNDHLADDRPGKDACEGKEREYRHVERLTHNGGSNASPCQSLLSVMRMHELHDLGIGVGACDIGGEACSQDARGRAKHGFEGRLCREGRKGR